MKELWSRYGLEPYPDVAPPYSHVLGRGRLVVAQFDVDSARWKGISDYWRLDTAATAVGDLTVRRGDLILWVGPDEHGGEAHAWPVSLVLEASKKVTGSQVVSALVFDDHEAILVDELPEIVSELLVGPAAATGAQRSLLLDLWGLDVLCPRCGGLGTPISYGLQLPPEVGDDQAVLGPWDTGHAHAAGGCVVGEERYACGRCGRGWPSMSDHPARGFGGGDFHTSSGSAWHPPVNGSDGPGSRVVEGGPDASTRSS